MRTPKSPIQVRGKQRVAHLLAAADYEIAKVGYDAVTMSQIAKRADAAIGSLYQFFPSKEAVVQELRKKYCSDLLAIWASLKDKKFPSPEAFCAQFADLTLEFLKDHKSFLALIYAPSSTRNPAITKEIERELASVIKDHVGGLSKKATLRKASSVLQISKSMMTLYSEAKGRDNKWIAKEFKSVLSAYLREK